ncbi:MAG TPA: cyclic nucleotide-binding domain-containing protein [Candidatus Acidoferrales bacterium]|jgi:CRP-like cAMP-binding protein|nr:cyclic nucleotide-binding domain-containing protein [Candidatus Acidoferrales bacterium]
MEQPASYFIWGVDDSPYGPVELSMLLDWIKDGRVLADTWVYEKSADAWGKASQFRALQGHFGKASQAAADSGITPSMLRRIKILGHLKDTQLAHLCDFMEVHQAEAHSLLFKQGDIGDAMYLVLSGELRARVLNGSNESILSTFRTGDFFGDMALFDNGPRSADVVSSTESTLLKISAPNFFRLIREAPALATPFLQATVRTLSSRIRADNKRITHISEQFSASRGL